MLSSIFILCGSVAVGIAQDVPAGCDANVQAWNDNGLERIVVTSPCRRNEQVHARYGVLQQETVFSDEGVAHFNIALTNERNPIILSYKVGKPDTVFFDTAGLSTVFRVTLQWDMPVDLNLHVVEPGGILNSKGDATANHAPEQYDLKGRLDLTDDGTGVSPFQESYVFPDRIGRPSDIFTIYVEDVSRGRVPSGRHCENGELAQIEFSLVIADQGKIRRQQFKLEPLPCGRTIEDRIYYFRPRL
jgi:hypothetical protein